MKYYTIMVYHCDDFLEIYLKDNMCLGQSLTKVKKTYSFLSKLEIVLL